MRIHKFFFALILISLLLSSCLSAEADQAAIETETANTTRMAGLTLIADITKIAKEVYTTQTAQIPEATQTLSYKPGDTRISAVDGMVMVYIPAGNATLGSDETRIAWAAAECVRLNNGYSMPGCTIPDLMHETPVHIIFQEAFWMDKTEVTNVMFSKFIKDTGYQTDAETWKFSYSLYKKDWRPTKNAHWAMPLGEDSGIAGREDHPVVNISWNDAWSYCQWAGRRLPTEVEWEYAAGGPDGFMFPWGDDPSYQGRTNMADVRIKFNVDLSNPDIDDGYLYTAPPGNFPDGASPFGVLDMAGNVREWIYDGFAPYHSSADYSDNHFNEIESNQGITRGGSFASLPIDLRVASRKESDPLQGYSDLGFRCVDSALLLPEPEIQKDFLPDLILLKPFDHYIPDPEGEEINFWGNPKGEEAKEKIPRGIGLEVIGKYGKCSSLKISRQDFPDSWIRVDEYANKNHYILYEDCLNIEEILIRPPSGKMFPRSIHVTQEDASGGRLQVTNLSSYDTYVSLVNIENENTYGIYLRDGQTEALRTIKDGTYDVYYTTGSEWSSVEGHFLSPNGYQKLEDTLKFNQNTIWEFTIDVIEGGNAPADQINAAEFPSVPE
ncbi:MAG: formylglycine-generating enzyme family protein [Anaerolineaceae bacterium]|nr:formylglycine-generating enzyme family protein [Anaerolineaceae bacterium]